MSRPIIRNIVIIISAFIFATILVAMTPIAHAQIGLDFLNLPADAEIGPILSRFYVFGVSMTAILALIMFTIGGVRYMIAGDRDPGPAKEQMKNALFGLILALTSYLILYTINPKLVQEVKTTAIVDLQQPASQGQQAKEGEVCGGVPKDPKHPESVTCAAGKCYTSKDNCTEAVGNLTGNCFASCEPKKKVAPGGPCSITAECADTPTYLCRIKVGPICRARTGSDPEGYCLNSLCTVEGPPS